ncbi:MAG: hypothetical protein JJT77_11290 [Crocinitomicaceae bacterium]|nr:hypothetical protein [Crocinitomicaceae bacterium]
MKNRGLKYMDLYGYLSMSGRQFLGLTATGFLAGLANYGINSDIDYEFKNQTFNKIAIKSHRFLGGAGVSYLDYIVNHQIIYGNYYGGPTEYYGYGNKMGIGGIKNIFSWLILRND